MDWDSDKGVDADLARAHTLHKRHYFDPETLALEKRLLFASCWQPVGRADQVARPGDYFTTSVADEPLLVVRGHDGELRAMSNVCRHRASLVSEGCGNARFLSCPYHAWTYRMDGSLHSAPEFDGVKDWQKEDVRLPAFRVDTWGPLIFAHLGDGQPTMQETLGAITSEIQAGDYPLNDYRFLARTDYLVECNWKIYVDNYLEGYHIPTVHPALYRELDYARYQVETFRYHSSQMAPLRPVREGSARRYDPSEGAPKPLYYWVFPNTLINVYPDNLHINAVLPVSEEKTLVTFEWFTAPGSKLTKEECTSLSEQVQKEDTKICELVQRGLKSKAYSQGRYSVKRENGVHHFHRLWMEFMERPSPSRPSY